MIQAITVCYETPALITKAVESVCKHYPRMRILIIDGSRYESECYKAVNKLKLDFPNVDIYHTFYNIGHGNGLQFGIEKTNSKYLLLFDSDIVLLSKCIKEMKAAIKGNTIGSGYICTVDTNGVVRPNGINYLHPYFALIERKEYEKLMPIKNHGAPLIDTMIDARKKRKSFARVDLSKAVEHKFRGTRNINKNWMNQL